MPLKVLELFGGIGACTQALKRNGVDFEVVDYVEIDTPAVRSYNAINNTYFQPQDISKWDKDIEVDLIMHGSPCQSFSIAGKQEGGDEGSGTRSSLMYETLRIVKKLKPTYVVWENVKNLLSDKHKHNFDAYLERMEQMGYTNHYKVLNSKDFGVPQNRERIFTVSILKSGMTEPSVEEYLFPDGTDNSVRPDKVGNIYPSGGQNGNVYSAEGIAPTLLSGTTDTEGNGGVGSSNSPKIIIAGNVYPNDHMGGRVYDPEGIAPTVMSAERGGGCIPKVVEPDSPSDVVNPLKGISGRSWQFEQNVYADGGIARTLKANGGSGNIPKVIEGYEFPEPSKLPIRLRDILEPKVDEKYYLSRSSTEFVLDVLNKTAGTTWERRFKNAKLNPDYAGTVSCTNTGIQRVGLSTYIVGDGSETIPVSEYKQEYLKRRDRIGYKILDSGDIRAYDVVKGSGISEGHAQSPDNIAHTVLAEGNPPAVYEGDPHIIREPPLDRPGWHRNATEVLNADGISRCISTQSNNLATKIKDPNDFRIRRLTPLECWRLQGFDDECYYAAEKVNSNTQLYKQAGNSITVNVLCAIFGNLPLPMKSAEKDNN